MSKDTLSYEFPSEQDVLSLVRVAIHPQACKPTLLAYVPVSPSESLKKLAKELYQVVLQASFTELAVGFTAQELEEALSFILTARVWQVNKGRFEAPYKPAYFEAPTFLGPMLAAVGRYRDPVRNLDIIPVPDPTEWPTLVSQGDDGLKVNLQAVLKAPPSYRKVIDGLRRFGVRMAQTLPYFTEVDTDEMYRLSVVDDFLQGTDAEHPSDKVLFIRTLVQMSYLEALFGELRVVYAACGAFNGALSTLATRCVPTYSFRSDQPPDRHPLR